MSCHWRARFELRAECGVNPPGEELSARRAFAQSRSERSDSCRIQLMTHLLRGSTCRLNHLHTPDIRRDKLR